MNTIFQTLVYEREKGHDAVLATIIWDDGSAPRGKGSQMLVGQNGLLAGTIGGGAVEGQAIAISREMLADGTDSRIREFRLRRDGSAQSTGMVCGGDVTVYFRRIPMAEDAWDALASEALRRIRQRQEGWLVQPLDGGIPYLTEEKTTDKENCFTMPLPVGERAIIFGGGHIARALVPLTEELQKTAAALIIKDDLSVRQTELLVKKLTAEKKDAPAKNVTAVDYAAEAARELGERLGRPCKIVTGKKKGRIELEYYGVDDLNALLDALHQLKK